MKKISRSVLIILCLFLLCGCGKFKPYIAYTVYPIGYALNRISGGILDARSIQTNEMIQVAHIKDNADGNYAEILNNSAYLFHIGELEPYYSLYEQEIKDSGVEVVDLASLNAIYKFQRYTLVYVNNKEKYVESPYYDSPLFAKVDTNENDLMLWMDPIGMLSIAKDIYELLAANYVEEAENFKANFKNLENDLISLDAAYQALALELKQDNQVIKFVSTSAGFGNWQKAYGFQVYPLCLSKYGALPSAEELAFIKQKIKDDEVKFIAYEPNMPTQMIDLFNEVEDELHLTRVNLNNISSLTPTQYAGNKDYLSLMYENLHTLENMKVALAEDKKNAAGHN